MTADPQRHCVACNWTSEDGYGAEAHLRFIHPDRDDLIVVEQMGHKVVVAKGLPEPITAERARIAALVEAARLVVTDFLTRPASLAAHHVQSLDLLREALIDLAEWEAHDDQ